MACITEQQRAILDSFSIERLSDSEENLRLVSDFQNSRSDSLTNKIQSEAFEEDELGTVAFYVIKDKDGNPNLGVMRSASICTDRTGSISRCI